ncbi:MAG TPA: GNAT family N-acetyltransferase [Lacipirellulaceae bacterium]|jgi:ribosomal protein S18 acetylase RimI-like enzyme|nr:GNAT family N-acetyltransferase [Lacipirellulaceae bacterium]
MESAPLEVIPCPPNHRIEALSLVLYEIAPSQRREIAGELISPRSESDSQADGLFVAMRGDVLRGSVWVQPQPGNTAVLWPPKRVAGEPRHSAFPLLEAAIDWLDSTAIGMAQVLLPRRDDPDESMLESVGFSHLAELLYLTCESARFPVEPLPKSKLQFVPYEERERQRLGNLIERTYLDSLDCPALNGARGIDDVIAGYGATGLFRPENWQFVRHEGNDVGMLLLADHPSARHWELVYMGLVPEARGHGWGRQITQHAQSLARRANVDRIVLAVDAANSPALAMYRAAGFEMWDRRNVYVRFAAAP